MIEEWWSLDRLKAEMRLHCRYQRGMDDKAGIAKDDLWRREVTRASTKAEVLEVLKKHNITP